MSTKDVSDCYRTRFQLEFCFRDAKHYAGLNDCQSTDLRKLEFHTGHVSRELGIPLQVDRFACSVYQPGLTSCKQKL